MFEEEVFRSSWSAIQKSVHETAKEKGFIDNFQIITQLALVGCEVSEAIEAIREGNPPCDKTSGMFSNFEIELADIIIRVMTIAEHMKINLPKAIIAKANYNKCRPFMHGKKF